MNFGFTFTPNLAMIGDGLKGVRLKNLKFWICGYPAGFAATGRCVRYLVWIYITRPRPTCNVSRQLNQMEMRSRCLTCVTFSVFTRTTLCWRSICFGPMSICPSVSQAGIVRRCTGGGMHGVINNVVVLEVCL